MTYWSNPVRPDFSRLISPLSSASLSLSTYISVSQICLAQQLFTGGLSVSTHSLSQLIPSISGEAGTTGREVFEHSTATGPGPGYGKDHGQSATSGFEGSDGIGRGGKVDHHHDTSGGAPAVTGSAGHDLVGGTAGASGRQTEGGDPHADTGAHLPGSTGTGGGVPPPAPAGEVHHGHHHHHHHHQEATGTGIGASETVSVSSLLLLFEFQSLRPLQSAIRDTYGDNAPGGAGGGVTDRVGSLNQGGAMYERTTDQGPITGGAAGTDRFDTDKPRAGNA